MDRLDDELLTASGGVRHYALHIANYVSTLCWDATNGTHVKGQDHRTTNADRVTCALCRKFMEQAYDSA